MNEHSVRDFFLLFSSLGQTTSISTMKRGEIDGVPFDHSSCSPIMDND